MSRSEHPAESCGCTSAGMCPRHAEEALRAYERALADVAGWLDYPDAPITGQTHCGCCGEPVWRVETGQLVCATCDAMALWPSMAGRAFYDQERDSNG